MSSVHDAIDLLPGFFRNVILISGGLDDRVDPSKNGVPIDTNIAHITSFASRQVKALRAGHPSLSNKERTGRQPSYVAESILYVPSKKYDNKFEFIHGGKLETNT